MKLMKTLKTLTIYHGLEGEHTDTIADTQEANYGSMALASFLHGMDIVYDNLYIMFDAICHVEVTESIIEEEIDDDTCESGDEPTPGTPHIDGADNTSIHQGAEFDLEEGVKAYDANGNEIPFTVEPSTIDTCDVGSHVFSYSAGDITKERTITIRQIANPTISGLDTLVVEVNEEFDPLEGVTGVDGNGNEVEVTYEEPVQHVTLVNVANYTAPNSEHTPTINPWLWEGDYDVYMEGVLADGVPVTLDRWYTENDTHFVMVFGSFEVTLRLDYDSYFTSELRGMNPPNEVTFERLVIKSMVEG